MEVKNKLFDKNSETHKIEDIDNYECMLEKQNEKLTNLEEKTEIFLNKMGW